MNDWKTMKDGREKYGRYLASREWALLKEQVHKRADGKCERCRINPIDAVHHLTYVRKYQEDLADLQAICKPCHEFTHGKSDYDPRGPVKTAPTCANDLMLMDEPLQVQRQVIHALALYPGAFDDITKAIQPELFTDCDLWIIYEKVATRAFDGLKTDMPWLEQSLQGVRMCPDAIRSVFAEGYHGSLKDLIAQFLFEVQRYQWMRSLAMGLFQVYSTNKPVDALIDQFARDVVTAPSPGCQLATALNRSVASEMKELLERLSFETSLRYRLHCERHSKQSAG